MRAACVGVAGFLAMSGELVAAEDSGAATSLEEIVVTAERRPQLIQEVPLSLVAFTGEQLNQARVMNLPDLDLLVPGLSLPVSSSVDNLRLNIRGVGSIGDAAVASSVATYIDEEYIARPGALLNTFVDVERVEVLRGPQGVLYGRNATVGVINLRSRNPVMNETDAWMQAAVGTDEYREVQAVGNAAMGSKVAGRLALSYRERDGYGRNTFEGEDPEFGAVEDTVVRAKLGFQPSENFSGVVKAEYSKLDYGGSVIEVLSSTVTPANLATLTFLSGGQAPDVEDTYDYRVRQASF